MASRPTYADYRRHTGEAPKREPLSCTTSLAQGVYFKDGAMNRDGHGSTPNPEAPTEGMKTVRVEHYHYRSKD